MLIASNLDMLVDGKPHDEQSEQLGDDHGGEELETQRVFESPFVGEHLRHQAQAR